MHSNITIFENLEFGKVRVSMVNGVPYFCLADVCKVLEIGNPSDVKKRLNPHGVDSIEVGVQTGTKADGTPAMQNVSMTFINESNLYKTIFQSRKSEAEKFSDWVTSEVLPSIRKTGSYSVITKLDSYMIEDPVERANRWIEEYKEKQLLIEENIEMKPKAEYYDDIVDRQLNLNFRDTAKEIGVKVNVFMNTLREKKYIYKDRYGNNKPYSKYINNEDINKNLFVIKECCSSRYQGNQTLITPSGRNYFRQMFSEQN